MSPSGSLHLFDAFGIELEYMIVDKDSLDVRPIADQLLTEVAGELTGEVELGSMAWSNELALHVLEFKVSDPVSDLTSVAQQFMQQVQHANSLLAKWNACLLPTAMHPWMNPATELRLWPHDNGPIYETFDRIFDCRGHGWANLQSTHWNLPFHGDEEFGRLHAAIRIVLPLLPALAASSPIFDNQKQPWLDSRLEVYQSNCARIPSISGLVIPEPVFSERDYRSSIYEKIDQDIGPFDPHAVLNHVWLNARGAIARFDRGAIEIRVLDIQESPPADLAIGQLMLKAISELCQETYCRWDSQRQVDTVQLAGLLQATILAGPQAGVPSVLLGLFGIEGRESLTVGELWRIVFERNREELDTQTCEHLQLIIEQGTLAQRILDAIESKNLKEVYDRLAHCLQHGSAFNLMQH
ncbi:MAG: hypothetical protein KDB03_00995 [Planctomycetales bacterium]|nr:hypothetical protein [Planctomycetales bacterium]